MRGAGCPATGRATSADQQPAQRCHDEMRAAGTGWRRLRSARWLSAPAASPCWCRCPTARSPSTSPQPARSASTSPPRPAALRAAGAMTARMRRSRCGTPVRGEVLVLLAHRVEHDRAPPRWARAPAAARASRSPRPPRSATRTASRTCGSLAARGTGRRRNLPGASVEPTSFAGSFLDYLDRAAIEPVPASAPDTLVAPDAGEDLHRPAVAGTGTAVPATSRRPRRGSPQRLAERGCQGALWFTTSQNPQLCWRSMILAGVIALSPAGTSDMTRSSAVV